MQHDSGGNGQPTPRRSDGARYHVDRRPLTNISEQRTHTACACAQCCMPPMLVMPDSCDWDVPPPVALAGRSDARWPRAVMSVLALCHTSGVSADQAKKMLHTPQSASCETRYACTPVARPHPEGGAPSQTNISATDRHPPLRAHKACANSDLRMQRGKEREAHACGPPNTTKHAWAQSKHTPGTSAPTARTPLASVAGPQNHTIFSRKRTPRKSHATSRRRTTV